MKVLSKLFGFLKKSIPKSKENPLEVVSEALIDAAIRGQTSPAIYYQVCKLIGRAKGLKGREMKAFKQRWKKLYRWQETQYLIDAAQFLNPKK